MIHTYVNECQHTVAYQPTVEGFLSWNPNYTYYIVRQSVFNFALAIIITKTGDYPNDVKAREADRYKFKDLFFGFNHFKRHCV